MNPILMVVYDRTPRQSQLSRAAFESAIAQDIPVEIRILNNGSTCPDTLQWLAGETRALIFNRAENQSPLKLANHHGESLIDKHGYFLGIPNDVVLPPNLYRKMLEWPQGVVAASMDGQNPPMVMEDVHRIHGDVHMAVPLIRGWTWKALVEAHGHFFDPGFFNYASDCDLKLRLIDAGIPTAQLDIQCWHYGGASHRLAPNWAEVHRQADRDRDYFAKKWGFAIGSPEYDRRIARMYESEKETSS
jgi:hypothetical protein